MDCFFNCLESIIRITSNKATPNISPTEALNKRVMTNITNRTDTATRNTTVETSGPRLTRLSFHKVINSTEWFFFTIMARKKGDMHKIVKTAPANGPQIPGKCSRSKGTTKRNERVITEILTMEYTTRIRAKANNSFRHKLSWLTVRVPVVYRIRKRLQDSGNLRSTKFEAGSATRII